MHILYLCQYFPPEMGAPAARCYEFSKRWVSNGHKVSVVAGIPNHPTGKLYEGYAKKIIHSEFINGIRVYRTWIYVTPNAGTLRRSLNYFSYALSSVITSETIRDVDVVIASSPQFLTGVTGMIVKSSKHIPFILEIRDLWPDSIDAVEAKVPQPLIQILSAIERKMYEHADHIIIVSDGFRNHIKQRGIPEEKISTITNGVNRFLFYPQKKNRIFLNGELKDKFILIYVGTHGMAHGLETILESARQLNNDNRFHFIFVGEGARKKYLKESSSDLSNITYIDRQTRENVAQLINESDAAIVHLKNSPLFRTVIPSKIFEIMGCGCPMILGVEGEAKKIITQAHAGICIQPENANQLSDAVCQLYQDSELRKKFGENASTYVNQHYNLDVLAKQYLQIIESVRV